MNDEYLKNRRAILNDYSISYLMNDNDIHIRGIDKDKMSEFLDLINKKKRAFEESEESHIP
jgi:hypothetical protein